jgi:ABC-type tungstate transport system substrate-binding protein
MLIHKMAAAAAGLGLEVVEVTATMMVGSRIEL